MATGGSEFGYEDPALDRAIDNDDDDQEANGTQPFQPGAASTPCQPSGPYHGAD